MRRSPALCCPFLSSCLRVWSRPEPLLPIGAALLSPRLGADCLTIAGVLAKPGAGADLVASIPRAPWGVQVAGNFLLNRAMASYSVLQKQYGAVLADRLPMVVRTVIRSKGTARSFRFGYRRRVVTTLTRSARNFTR
jgi:hypothetical protein